MTPTWEGIRAYMGADASSMQGRRFNLAGHRMFSSAYGPMSAFTAEEVPGLAGMLDSGAFTDVRKGRLPSPEAALQRQLRWEQKASLKWGHPFVAEALASYDLLIDEKLVGGVRKKERWTVSEGESAVRETVEAAAYLSRQRQAIAPRRLLMGCQGVDAEQYSACADGVLAHCERSDIFGLGGWCILGMYRSWLPVFWSTLRRVLPKVDRAGLSWVHIFGVMWEPALGGLLWLADQHGLQVSTDSSKAAMDVTWKDPKKAGRRRETWEENVAWWHDRLANLRSSKHYREPPDPDTRRQHMLFG